MPILTAQERVGTRIDDKIRLDRILGEGGMGVVYAGVHLGLDLPVAVKFLHGELARHDEIVSRFLNEARATSRLRHPNVIDVRDVGKTDDGSAYMVLELLRGESLATRLETRGALSYAESEAILGPVMEGLAAAHAAGIIHRDIKPDNVFLSLDAQGAMVPKVLDFGIAKLADGSGSGSATATGAVMGTPYYMAPEQALGRKHQIGPWSDVWSTAVMSFECLAGGLPFALGEESSMAAILLALMTAEIHPLSRFRTDAPRALDDLLLHALAREPRQRIQTMSELRAGFVGALRGVADSGAPGRRAPHGLHTGPLGMDATMAPVSNDGAVHGMAESARHGAVATGAPTLAGAPPVRAPGSPAVASLAAHAAPTTSPPTVPARPASSPLAGAIDVSLAPFEPHPVTAATTTPTSPSRPWIWIAVVGVAAIGVALAAMTLSSGEEPTTAPTTPIVAAPATTEPTPPTTTTSVPPTPLQTEPPQGEPLAERPTAEATPNEHLPRGSREDDRHSRHDGERHPSGATTTTMVTSPPPTSTTTPPATTTPATTTMTEHRGGTVSIDDF